MDLNGLTFIELFMAIGRCVFLAFICLQCIAFYLQPFWLNNGLKISSRTYDYGGAAAATVAVLLWWWRRHQWFIHITHKYTILSSFLLILCVYVFGETHKRTKIIKSDSHCARIYNDNREKSTEKQNRCHMLCSHRINIIFLFLAFIAQTTIFFAVWYFKRKIRYKCLWRETNEKIWVSVLYPQ